MKARKRNVHTRTEKVQSKGGEKGKCVRWVGRLLLEFRLRPPGALPPTGRQMAGGGEGGEG